MLVKPHRHIVWKGFRFETRPTSPSLPREDTIQSAESTGEAVTIAGLPFIVSLWRINKHVVRSGLSTTFSRVTIIGLFLGAHAGNR